MADIGLREVNATETPMPRARRTAIAPISGSFRRPPCPDGGNSEQFTGIHCFDEATRGLIPLT